MRRFESLLGFWAAVIGMAGVALAAASAHLNAAPSLSAAALILLAHGPAILSGLALSKHDLAAPTPMRISSLLLAIGATLFAADIALRVFANMRLFPMAAPLGGVLLMIGWGLMGLAAILRLITRTTPRDKDSGLG